LVLHKLTFYKWWCIKYTAVLNISGLVSLELYFFIDIMKYIYLWHSYRVAL
jgi:hypothetical protein